MGHRTRVVAIEDHALFAELLRLALGKEGYDVEVLDPGGVRHTDELLHRVSAREPAIVLLDLALGRHDGVLLIRPLTRTGAAVIVVTGSTDRSVWGGCLHSGARGIFPKHRHLSELVETVRSVEAGVPLVGPDEYRELLDLWQTTRAELDVSRTQLARLTRREAEILGELMDGCAIHEIARRDHVTEGTVRKQVCSVLSKLEVSTQVAAVGLAYRAGWAAGLHSS